MNRESVIESLELKDHGLTYKASYYIENGMLHADVAGRRQTTLCIGIPAADMVRALLAERILQMSYETSRLRRG